MRKTPEQEQRNINHACKAGRELRLPAGARHRPVERTAVDSLAEEAVRWGRTLALWCERTLYAAFELMTIPARCHGAVGDPLARADDEGWPSVTVAVAEAPVAS